MKLPPMNALRAFEAVSRHLSVSKAAEELCVSQGAVSQQLRNLEDHLGRELFVRTPNSFTLSEEGEAFAGVVQQSLKEIAIAARGVARTKIKSTLTISVSQGFAVKWLMPNLADFYKAYPEVTVVLDESVKLATFKNDGVDGAIRFSDGKFKELNNVLLFRSQLYAMASAAYISEHGKLESLAQPGQHRLIDYQYKSKDIRAQHINWEDVISKKRINSEIQPDVFPDEHQAFNAALQGRGIALIPNYLMEEEIETGKIEYANPEPIPSRFSYYFVSPINARPNNTLFAFRDWLVDSLEKYRVE
jgi:LysR family glycine cleavage system transcriptional activator